jgi:hypothetical protein
LVCHLINAIFEENSWAMEFLNAAEAAKREMVTYSKGSLSPIKDPIS